MGRRLGLIIGINQYQDPSFQPLRFAENDSRALAQWLVNIQGGKWIPSDVQLVQGIHATRELAESLISQICLQIAEPDDLVMIYFAGHAFIDDQSGEGYLALTNTRYHDAANTAIHLRAFAEHILARSRAAHILLVLDCFQNGSIWSRYRSYAFDAQPLLGSILSILQQQSNRLILCSCRGNELAPEAGDRVGLFVQRMIIGLSGQINNQATSTNSLQQLQMYLSTALPDQQRAQLFGRERSPLLLVGNVPAPSGLQQMTNAAEMPFSASFGPGPSSTIDPARQPMVDMPPYATMTMQRDTSAQIPQSMVDQHLQQQSKVLLGQAQQLLQAQSYAEAFTIVERILQVLPNDPAALLLKAQILGTAGQSQEALAIVERLQLIDSQNALVWSMRAVLLSNMGQHQGAQAAIERSLELDASNPESYGIKNTIMANVAATQLTTNAQQASRLSNPSSRAGRGRAFFLVLIFQIFALGLGVLGIAISILLPTLPALVAQASISLGSTMLCASAIRVSYRYGFLHILPTFLITLVAGAASVIIAGPFLSARLTTPITARLLSLMAAHPTWMPSIAFLVGWLALAATLPLLLAIIGAIAGIGGARRH